MGCSILNWCSNNGAKYFVVFIWLTVNALLFWRTFKYYYTAPEFFYLHEMLGLGLCISRATASVINLNLGALMLPVSRGLIAMLRAPICCKISRRTFRILLDRFKGFHITCAAILTIASLLHFMGHSYNAQNYSLYYNSRFKDINAALYKGQDPLFVVLASVPGATGIVLMAILSMIVSSAVYHVRVSSFDIFWYTHRLFILFYLLTLIHAIRGILKQQTNIEMHTPGCIYINISGHAWAEPEPEVDVPPLEEWKCVEDPSFTTLNTSTWMWVAGPLFIYSCDSVWRYFRSKSSPVSIVNVTVHNSDVIEIHMIKDGFFCRPGQFILLQCPSISSFEWHPYTVSKCPSENCRNFTVHVKALGDWSGRLKDCFVGSEDNPDSAPLLPMGGFSHRLYIDGPFGSPLEDVLRYRLCLCVAGGIGITPFISVLHYIRENVSARPERLYLVWICRDVDLVLNFSSAFNDISNQYWEANRPDGFDLQLFITGNTERDVKARVSQSYLSRRISMGRPDWQGMFGRVSASHPREKVGVFSCGPKTLSRSIEKQCNKSYIFGTVFHNYHESF